VIEGFHDFDGCVVVRGVVEGEVAVVVFLSGSFGEYLEEEFHAVQGAFFPGGEVKGEVSVVVRDGGGFWVCF